MHVFFPGDGEQIDQEIYLHQRLSACHGNSSVLIKCFISLVLFKNLLRLHHGAAGHGPGIRIVAIGTAHGTSLHEHDKTCAGAVHGAEAFE